MSTQQHLLSASRRSKCVGGHAEFDSWGRRKPFHPGWVIEVRARRLIRAATRSIVGPRRGSWTGIWTRKQCGTGRGRPVRSKLDPYKAIIDARLAEYPKLTVTRLFKEVQDAGYPELQPGEAARAKRVRPRPPVEPVQRFETPTGHQDQVDFADFRLPWGKRHALIVVFGYSRLMWLNYFER